MFKQRKEGWLSLRSLAVPMATLALLGILILLYVMTSSTTQVVIPHLTCVNPQIKTRRFEDKRFNKAYKLIQVINSLTSLNDSGTRAPESNGQVGRRTPSYSQPLLG
jgi:hypothetical protein